MYSNQQSQQNGNLGSGEPKHKSNSAHTINSCAREGCRACTLTDNHTSSLKMWLILERRTVRSRHEKKNSKKGGQAPLAVFFNSRSITAWW
jgi:hypothetical protein